MGLSYKPTKARSENELRNAACFNPREEMYFIEKRGSGIEKTAPKERVTGVSEISFSCAFS
jgi:hypothetical protein